MSLKIVGASLEPSTVVTGGGLRIVIDIREYGRLYDQYQAPPYRTSSAWKSRWRTGRTIRLRIPEARWMSWPARARGNKDE